MREQTWKHVDDPGRFGERLAATRRERGLSQRRLADGWCSPAYISRIEAGERVPSLQLLRELAGRLSVSEHFLAWGEEEPVPRDSLTEAEVALRLDDLAVAQELYETAAEETEPLARAHALAGLGQVAFRQGDARTAVARFEEALELDPDVRTPALVETLGRAYATRGDRPAAIAAFEGELARAEESGDPLGRIRFGVLLANALIDNSNFGRAAETLASALNLAQETGDPLLRARLYWSQSRFHALGGDPEAAAEYARKALAILEVTEETHHVARAYQMLAFIELERDRPDVALPLLQKGRELLAPTGSAIELAKFRLEEARALVKLGEPAKGVEVAMEVAGVLAEGDPIESGRSYASLAEAFAASGDRARARELYELALELLEQATPTRYLGDVYAALAELLEEADEKEAALDILKRAVRLQSTLASH